MNNEITFVLPVLNETYSLSQTIETILNLSLNHTKEILIVTADKTMPESMQIIQNFKNKYPNIIRIHKQQLPFLGGAFREAICSAKGNYIMLMASDMETNPDSIPDFIKTMKEGKWDIVAASRWITGGSFEGYSKIKLILNYLFQLFFKILYGTAITDLTYAYRLYRKNILDGIQWEELKHPFLLECLLKPMRCGARTTEIPCIWKARTEGTSANNLLQTFAYLRPALRIRFMSKKTIKPENLN